jgi:2',3'-cyclic-nucleotide 2'-phosphodiesterase (5'-nucleotidase family)
MSRYLKSRFVATVAAFLVATALAAIAPLPAFAQTAKLTLLHVNDVYQISPQRGTGGLAELMTLLKQERAGAENHITTLGGDLLSPSVMSGLTKGAQMVAVMNAIGLDYAGFGNHEFDFGDDILKQRIAESEFTWLATNTMAGGAPFGGAQATAIRQVGEFKVGLFSLITDETALLSSPGAGVTFAPVEEVASQAVADLKEQGADIIIAITHLDIAQDRALARSVSGINIILGGHDHDPIMFYEGGVLILKAGTDAQYLAGGHHRDREDRKARPGAHQLPPRMETDLHSRGNTGPASRGVG